MRSLNGVSQYAIGRYLAAIREAAGFRTQAELARKLTFSAATLSRIESGDKEDVTKELQEVLQVLAPLAPQAGALNEYLTQEWDLFDRPAFDHPDRETLWQAHRALRQLEALRTKKDIKAVFLRQVELYSQELHRVSSFLLSRDHQIAAVGPIGVGKTTALCKLVGLVNDGSNERLEKTVVLETGAGGITLCEVHLAQGPNYGLRIVPRTEDSIRADVEELAEHLVRLVHGADGTTPADDGLGISKEVVRAIRNMAGLVETRKEEGGRRIRIDPAKELAQQFSDPKELTIQIMTKMDLLRRRKRDAWYSPDEQKNPLAWLQDLFGKVNNGRHEEFTLPAKIEIVVRDPILGSEQLPIKIVDTKGVDQTAQRQDLESQFDDARTLVVLCTRFNDSPDVVAQTLLKRAREAGAKDIEAKTVILVLPHPGEALAVKHDSGASVEDDREGCELKRDAIDLRLENLGLRRIPVIFFNAKEDAIEPVRDELVGAIKKYRARYSVQIAELSAAVETLIANEKSETLRLTFEQVARHLATWLDSNRDLDWQDEQIQKDLIEAIDATRFAATVRASVRRLGKWENLDYYHHLAFGARRVGAQQIGKKVSAFKVIAKNLLDDKENAPTASFIGRLLEQLDSAVDTAYRTIQVGGREAFLSTLQNDYEFWRDCEAQWGAGGGYRTTIRDKTNRRIQEHCENARTMVKHIIEQEWRQVVASLDAMLKDNEMRTTTLKS